MAETNDRRGIVRGVAGLVAGILAVGALGITPALAAKFLTKQKANKRYLGNTNIVSSTVTVPDGGGTTIVVPCPSGMQATGGGANSPAFFADIGGDNGMLLLERSPLMSAGRSIGWVSEVGNFTTSPQPITGFAVCTR